MLTLTIVQAADGEIQVTSNLSDGTNLQKLSMARVLTSITDALIREATEDLVDKKGPKEKETK